MHNYGEAEKEDNGDGQNCEAVANEETEYIKRLGE